MKKLLIDVFVVLEDVLVVDVPQQNVLVEDVLVEDP